MSTPLGKPFDDTAFRSEGRTLAELFGALADETSTLIKQEIKLATTEVTEKTVSVSKQLGWLAAGALLASMGCLVLLAALVIGLSKFMELWLAAFLVGIFVAGIGGTLVSKGLAALRGMNLVPTRTLQSLQADKNLLQDQVR